MPSPDAAPDPLERLFRRLVTNLAALEPGALHRTVALADIHERLVPYRTHRALLGFDTSEDYEMTVLRLLAGVGGFATVYPDDVREALQREIAAVNPDLGLFRQFPDASVLLDPERTAAAAGEAAIAPEPAEPADLPDLAPPADDEPPPRAAPSRPAPRAYQPEPDDADDAGAGRLPFTLEDADEGAQPAPRPREVAPASAPCSYCGANLPVGRTVLFCPHCGQNVGVVHCPTCGSELDVGWTFCITCGQKVTGIG